MEEGPRGQFTNGYIVIRSGGLDYLHRLPRCVVAGTRPSFAGLFVNGIVQHVHPAKLVLERADNLVGVGYLAIIQCLNMDLVRIGEPIHCGAIGGLAYRARVVGVEDGGKSSGRRIRSVRLVRVHEQEERQHSILSNPFEAGARVALWPEIG